MVLKHIFFTFIQKYLNQNKPLQIERENKLRKKIGIDKKEAKLKP